MNAERIEEIRKRAEAATRGPWHGDYYLESADEIVLIGVMDGNSEYVLQGTIDGGIDGKDADIKFILEAREDIPALLAEVERLRKELAQCHRQIELADEQLTQYGDVKRKLHELQDFIYPDKVIAKRIKRVERDPESTVAWADIRREGGAE